MVIVRVILLLLVLFHAIDFGCTMMFLSPETELNPIAVKIWQEWGWQGITVLKFGALVVAIGAVELIGLVSTKTATIIASAMLAISTIPLILFMLLWAIL